VPVSGRRVLLHQNKASGFACVSCGWAKPKSRALEVCEDRSRYRFRVQATAEPGTVAIGYATHRLVSEFLEIHRSNCATAPLFRTRLFYAIADMLQIVCQSLPYYSEPIAVLGSTCVHFSRRAQGARSNSRPAVTRYTSLYANNQACDFRVLVR
jgi:hypothetical protein